MKVNEIIAKYTAGEATLEETNAALKKADANFHLDPMKNVLTAEEVKNGTAGLLDTATGSLDKVEIVDGELKYEINQVNADGTTNMKAYVLAGGKTYEVFGKKLVERK